MKQNKDKTETQNNNTWNKRKHDKSHDEHE